MAQDYETSKDDVTQLDENIDASLKPNGEKDRTVGKIPYMFMWVGDGVNMGNMTLGASIVVAGVATLNIWQTLAAAIISIIIITTAFFLNERVGYKKGIPYVVQLRMSFGFKGTIISSLMRAVPAVIWFGIQSWIGGTALNQFMKIITGGAFDNAAISFVVLVLGQIALSLYGFKSIKWVETVASFAVMAALIYVFVILINDHQDQLVNQWINVEGSWGLPFYGIIITFLGNYAAIFLNAADYSRELQSGISNGKRWAMYFSPIMMAYGFVIIVGAMLASVTGITNPSNAMAAAIDNSYVTLGVSAFIVIATIATNMVANIIAPTYVITWLTNIKYKLAVTIAGLLSMVSFPWLMVQNGSATGLDGFIKAYTAFLGPIFAILLIEFYILRRQQVHVPDLYKKTGPFAGFNPNAIIALCIGAAASFIVVDLAWIIGLVVAGVAYLLLTRFAFKDSSFKKGTIYDND